MNFDVGRLLTTRTGKMMMSIIWGLGLAALFKKACQGRNCQVIQYQGPNPEEVSKTYYKYGQDNCYRYIPYLTPCDTDSEGTNSTL